MGLDASQGTAPGKKIAVEGEARGPCILAAETAVKGPRQRLALPQGMGVSEKGIATGTPAGGCAMGGVACPDAWEMVGVTERVIWTPHGGGCSEEWSQQAPGVPQGKGALKGAVVKALLTWICGHGWETQQRLMRALETGVQGTAKPVVRVSWIRGGACEMSQCRQSSTGPLESGVLVLHGASAAALEMQKLTLLEPAAAGQGMSAVRQAWMAHGARMVLGMERGTAILKAVHAPCQHQHMALQPGVGGTELEGTFDVALALVVPEPEMIGGLQPPERCAALGNVLMARGADALHAMQPRQQHPCLLPETAVVGLSWRHQAGP